METIVRKNIKSPASPYVIREYDSGNESFKQSLRDVVCKHFETHHDSRYMRLFSIPSIHWRFEQQAAMQFAGCEFVAVEREIQILRQAMPYMPGIKPFWFRFECDQGWVDGIRTGRAKMLHADFNDFMQIGIGTLGKELKRQWSNEFCRWTAAWFDLSSNIFDDVEQSLIRIASHCSYVVGTIPIAITLQVGREQSEVMDRIGSAGGRAGYLETIMAENNYCHREWKTDRVDEYINPHGAKMMLMCGRLIMPSHMVEFFKDRANALRCQQAMDLKPAGTAGNPHLMPPPHPWAS